MTDDRELPNDSEEEISTPNRLARRHLTTNATLQGIVAAIPYVGSSLVAFYQARAAELQKERLEVLATNLSVRLEQLEELDRLDLDLLSSDEFAERFDEVARQVATERIEDKRELFATLLANSTRSDLDQTWYPTGLQLLERLDPVHVLILSKVDELRTRRRAPLAHEGFPSLPTVPIHEIAIWLFPPMDYRRASDFRMSLAEFEVLLDRRMELRNAKETPAENLGESSVQQEIISDRIHFFHDRLLEILDTLEEWLAEIAGSSLPLVGEVEEKISTISSEIATVRTAVQDRSYDDVDDVGEAMSLIEEMLDDVREGFESKALSETAGHLSYLESLGLMKLQGTAAEPTALGAKLVSS